MVEIKTSEEKLVAEHAHVFPSQSQVNVIPPANHIEEFLMKSKDRFHFKAEKILQEIIGYAKTIRVSLPNGCITIVLLPQVQMSGELVLLKSDYRYQTKNTISLISEKLQNLQELFSESGLPTLPIRLEYESTIELVS